MNHLAPQQQQVLEKAVNQADIIQQRMLQQQQHAAQTNGVSVGQPAQ